MQVTPPSASTREDLRAGDDDLEPDRAALEPSPARLAAAEPRAESILNGVRSAQGDPEPVTARLREGVHAVDIQGDLVLLDVARDGYFCVPQASVRIGRGGWLAIGDEAVARQLAEVGLLGSPGERADRAPEDAVREELPAPARTAVLDATPPPTWRQAPQVARCLIDVARHYRGRPLSHMVNLAHSRPPGLAPLRVTDGLLRCVRGFHAWVPYAPVSGKCLLRAFMLLRHLRRAGYDATWVFAVRTWPFGAHCWLQVEDLVLDDEPERLAPFHPILRL